MTRRRVLLLGSVAIVTPVAVAALLLWRHPSAVTQDNAARIKDGMTLAEVEAILGGPARDETGGAGFTLYPPGSFGTIADRWCEWIGPEYAVRVGFRDGRVVQVDSGLTDDPSVLQQIRRWLGL